MEIINTISDVGFPIAISLIFIYVIFFIIKQLVHSLIKIFKQQNNNLKQQNDNSHELIIVLKKYLEEILISLKQEIEILKKQNKLHQEEIVKIYNKIEDIYSILNIINKNERKYHG